MKRNPRLHLWLFLFLLYGFAGASSRATITVVSYWRLGENDPGAAPGVTATNTVDSAGTNNLAFVGSARYANDVAASAAIHTGSSLSINFTNGAYATNAIVSAAINNFGIECWVKPTAPAPAGGEVIAYNGSTASNGWGIILAPNNTYEALFGGAVAFGTNVASTNVWTHLALVRTNESIFGVATLYVNGVAAASSAVAPGGPAGNFALATTPESPTSQFFTGLLDEVRVFTFASGQFSTNDLLWNRSVSVSTTNLLEGPASGSDSVILAASPTTASWTNAANAGWLHFTAPNQSGTGSTNIIFSFDANPGATRSGTLTIAGQTVTVTQAGATYSTAGQPTGIFWGGQLPNGLAVDGAANVYVDEDLTRSLFKWSPAGNVFTVLVTNGFQGPDQIAADNSGNVYIADYYTNGILKWTANNQQLTTLISSGYRNDAVALDHAGNVYFTEYGTGTMRWDVADSNVMTLISNIAPVSLAVDYATNVYSALENGLITKWNAASQTSTNLVTGLSEPLGVAVDNGGNVYFSDYSAQTFSKWSAASNTVSVLQSGFLPEGVAVDSARNAYFVNSGNGGDGWVYELPYVFVDASGASVPPDAGTYSLPVVLPSTANLTGPFAPTTNQPWLSIAGITNGVVYYSVSANTNAARTGNILMLGKTIPVLQQGASLAIGATNLLEGPVTGQDGILLYVDPPIATWTVTANATWLHPVQTNGAGSTKLIFGIDANPGGSRTGSLTVSGFTVTVTQAGAPYVPASGAGVLAPYSTNSPCVAVDAAGNVYFVATNGSISQWSPASQAVTALVSNLLDSPVGLAVGQNTNIFFTDPSNHSVLTWTAAGGAVSTVVSNAQMVPLGVALDAAGNVYFVDTGNNTIKKWTAASSALTTVVSNGLSGPAGIAVDTLGNIYIADATAGSVWKWTAAGGGLSVFGTGQSPEGVAVDGSGNVYTADSKTNTIQKSWVAYVGVPQPFFTGLSGPQDVAVDHAQNVYVADAGNGVIKELPHAYVDSTGKQEPLSAGSDALAPVLPSTLNLGGPFTPVTDQGWLTSTGSTNGMASFSFTANTTGSNRTADINVLGQSVLVLQGQPAFRLGIDHRLEGPAAGLDSVLLALAPDAGTWTATTNASWLHLDPSSQSGTGDMTIVFSFDANTGPTRTGTLAIAGQTFTVIQAGSNYVQSGVVTSIVYTNLLDSVATDAGGNVYCSEDAGEGFRWTPSNQVMTTYGFLSGFEVTASDGGVVCEVELPSYVFITTGPTNIFELYLSSLPPNLSSVTSAVADDSGNIYYNATDIGDSRPDGSLAEFQVTTNWMSGSAYANPSANDLPVILATGFHQMQGIARDREDNIYFCALDGVYKWSPNSKTTIPAQNIGGYGSITVDGAGNIYTASQNAFIYKYTAASQTSTTFISGLSDSTGVAVDNEQDVYVADYGALKELPYVFVDPSPMAIGGAAGSGTLPPVLPASANLFPPFGPASDQSWLTITGTNNGVVSFAFTANTTGTNRTAHIHLFSQTISVTQSILVTPPVITGATVSSNGIFQFTFTNNQTTAFTVFSTTNLLLPLSGWTPLGSPSNTSPGVFQFMAPITNSSQRFYYIRSP